MYIVIKNPKVTHPEYARGIKEEYFMFTRRSAAQDFKNKMNLRSKIWYYTGPVKCKISK